MVLTLLDNKVFLRSSQKNFFSHWKCFVQIKNKGICILYLNYIACDDATKISTIRHQKTNSSPIPPEVPMRIMVTSVQWAWWRSFISSCNIIEIDGMPIPCCKTKRCHTQLSHLSDSEMIILTASVCLDKIVPTYADREHRSNLVHSIAVSSNADIWVLRFRVFHIKLCCNVLSECFHSPGTAPDTHKLGGKKRKPKYLSEYRWFWWCFTKNDEMKTITLTSLNIAGRSWDLVPKLKW